MVMIATLMTMTLQLGSGSRQSCDAVIFLEVSKGIEIIFFVIG